MIKYFKTVALSIARFPEQFVKALVEGAAEGVTKSLLVRGVRHFVFMGIELLRC
jgi:hypothetical protein